VVKMEDEKPKEEAQEKHEEESVQIKTVKKPFYDQNIELDFECKKRGHKEKITKRVYSVKNVIEPAVTAEVEIVTKCETVKTLNDFKEDSAAEETGEKKPEEKPEEKKEEVEGILSSVLGK